MNGATVRDALARWDALTLELPTAVSGMEIQHPDLEPLPLAHRGHSNRPSNVPRAAMSRAERSSEPYPFSTSIIVEPRAAGLSDTWTPAARNASFLAAAVSRPPLMTAPA